MEDKVFMKILYLHDIKKTGVDEISMYIEQELNLKYYDKFDIQILKPTYQLNRIYETLEYLKTLISFETPDLIIANGLGAWFTMVINSKIPALLINPMIDPVHDSKIMTGKTYVEFESYTKYLYNACSDNNIRYRGLFSKNDEMYNYMSQCKWHKLIGSSEEINCGHNINNNLNKVLEEVEFIINSQFNNVFEKYLLYEKLYDIKSKPAKHTINGKEVDLYDAMDILPGTLSDEELNEYNSEKQ